MDWDHDHSDQEDFQNDARELGKIIDDRIRDPDWLRARLKIRADWDCFGQLITLVNILYSKSIDTKKTKFAVEL